MSKTDERLSPGTAASDEEAFLLQRHLFAYEVAADHVRAADRVLDLGCGEGYGTKILSRNGSSVVGLDVSRNATRGASGSEEAYVARFVLYDGSQIPLRSRSIDVIVALQVLEHIRDTAGFLSEVGRVMTETGLFICTTPNRLVRLKPGQRPWNRFHACEYDSSSLAELLSGFFEEADIAGVAGTGLALEVETRRLARARRLAAIDPLNLRHRVPAQWVPPLMRLLRLSGRRQPGDRATAIDRSGSNYFVTTSDVETTFDLLATCKRPRR